MDRRLLEYNPETEAFEAGAIERGESERSSATSPAEELGEADEMEFAAGLLEVTSEAELDRFLGALVDRAARAVGSFASSPSARALTGILKDAAKQALPAVGRAIGVRPGDPTGAAIGSQVVRAAGRYLGLELEGLSPEDQEFEAAKSFIRFAYEAAKNAAGGPAAEPPKAAAQAAAIRAARRFGPGLLGPLSSSNARDPGSAESNVRPILAGGGRWVRRGHSIIVVEDP